MAFDDRKTEPLAAVGCLLVVCGLLAPVINRMTSEWWGWLLLALPVVVWAVLACVWWREDRES